jgi:DNA-binding GntR family transcriptional regulator
MTKKARKISKEMEAYLGIKKFIFERVIYPGQKIIYRDLEEMLGMSKTPIINAFARLEQEGLVISKQNRGYYIKKWSKAEIVQLYTLRTELEAIAIDFAIKHYDASDLALLKSNLDKYVNYDSEVYDNTRLKLDLGFHLQIAKIGGNDFLTSMLGQFYEKVMIGQPTFFLAPLIKRFKADHTSIYEAIKGKDASEAKKINSAHEMVSIKMLDKHD